MPVPRTPIIDDDGSGETGTAIDNAWKQELYDQIDAGLSGGLTWGSFTPTDVSGAGLVFGNPQGEYLRSGPAQGNANLFHVHFQLNIVFPANASANQASIAMPFPIKGAQGAGVAQGYGVQRMWLLIVNTSVLTAYDPISNAPITNQQMAGMTVVLSGAYMTY